MSSNLMPGDNSGPGGPDQPEGDCRDCDGTGMIDGENGEDKTCPRCDGAGFDEWEPLDDDVI